MGDHFLRSVGHPTRPNQPTIDVSDRLQYNSYSTLHCFLVLCYGLLYSLTIGFESQCFVEAMYSSFVQMEISCDPVLPNVILICIIDRKHKTKDSMGPIIRSYSELNRSDQRFLYETNFIDVFHMLVME